MRNSKVLWLAAVSTFVLGGAILAAAPNKIDDKLAEVLGKDVVGAAHPTAKNAALIEYKESSPKAGRLTMNIKMKYFGKVTKKEYKADVTLTLDTSDSPPKVLDLEYKDDNKVPASKAKLKLMPDALSKKLPKKL